ncbi:hypothetical protein [Sulfurimonas sp. HSL3-7]|uniref:hypothetical protein n=1 Tax=Sulfonitrofixus jiaomeiensis TaxID=3131938 RepID=UPI0031F77C13
MRKIVLILLFNLTLFASTNSCLLDVYFGNGVWNSLTQAQISRDKLKKFMQDRNPDKFTLADEKVTYDFKYAHNKTHGALTDLIESYWQLFESGQISEGYFTFVARLLDGSLTEDGFLDDLKMIISQSDGDTDAMYEKYQTESFNQKHNVLLVSHSQGNLFANKIYALLSDDERQHFRNVAVATPADNIASGGEYTTLFNDFVINTVPGSLPGNAEGFGHTFVNSYLNNPYDATVDKISLGLKNAVNALDENSCSAYLHFRWIGFICPQESDTDLRVEIYGSKKDGSFNIEEFIMTDARNRVEKVYNEQTKKLECPISGWDLRTTTPHYNRNGCTAYTFDDTSGGYHSLEYIASQTYGNVATCTQYNMSTAVFEILKKLE